MAKAQNQLRMTKTSIQNWPFKSVGQTSRGSSNYLLIFDLYRTCKLLLIIKHSTTIIYMSIYAVFSVMTTPEMRWSVVSNMQIQYVLLTWASTVLVIQGFLRLTMLYEDREGHVLSSEPALSVAIVVTIIFRIRDSTAMTSCLQDNHGTLSRILSPAHFTS